MSQVKEEDIKMCYNHIEEEYLKRETVRFQENVIDEDQIV